MRLLVTGSTGYIGQHILQCLPKGISIYAPKQNEYNLLNKLSIIEILANYRPTHCLHLAWNIKGNYTQAEFNTGWLESGKILIKNFYKYGGKRFIGSGTCYEYEDKNIPHMEYEPIAIPKTAYGRSKLSLKNFLSEYAEKINASWGWARPFFITGPGEPHTRFVPSLINNLRHGQEFLLKSPNRFLDYLDVRDVAAALCHLLFSCHCGIFNISSNVGITLADVADMLIKIGKFSGKLIYGNEYQEPMYCIGDNSRLIELLDFYPKYNIEQSLSDSIKDMIRKA